MVLSVPVRYHCCCCCCVRCDVRLLGFLLSACTPRRYMSTATPRHARTYWYQICTYCTYRHGRKFNMRSKSDLDTKRCLYSRLECYLFHRTSRTSIISFHIYIMRGKTSYARTYRSGIYVRYLLEEAEQKKYSNGEKKMRKTKQTAAPKQEKARQRPWMATIDARNASPYVD